MASVDRRGFGTGWAGRAGRGGGRRRARPVAEVLEGRQLLSTITVTSGGDADGANGSNTLSLRQAIEIANGTLAVSSLTASQAALVAGALSTPNTIDFNIPGSGPFTIEPTSALPTITSPVIIDGYSQPGAHPNTNGPRQADNAILEIDLNGAQAGSLSSGLVFQAGESTVDGLAIGGFGSFSSSSSGIVLEGFGNLIEGNFIGTDTTGTRSIGSNLGILAQGGGSNTIGGTAPAARNLISGNLSGFSTALSLSDSSSNLVEGNLIGTDSTGTRALGDGFGVAIAVPIRFPSTMNNSGNMGGGSGNTIGGTTAGAGNVISGSLYDGISGDFAPGLLIEGNFLGTDITGLQAIPDGVGINVTSGDGITIGGTTAGARNVISGNLNTGLNLQSVDVLVEGNYIGVDATGEAALPNGTISIAPLPYPYNAGIDFGGSGGSGTIGGTTSGAGNVISGNAAVGLYLSSGPTEVVGNFIGTDAAGTRAIPNETGMILAANFNRPDTIGGTAAGSGNVISGNLKDGLEISPNDDLGYFTSPSNLIEGNDIGVDATGTNALPNGGYGILIEAGPNNTIGGTSAGAGNVIAFNGKAGVGVAAEPANPEPANAENNGNVISGNSIFANGALGIDLGLDGVTPNTPSGDPTGPNRLQPYPVLSSASVNTFGTLVLGSLAAAPSTSYTVEFFTNPVTDPSGFGQGKTYLGSTVATTDASGHAPIQFATAASLGGQAISATATDPTGDTSEFARDLALIATTTRLTLGQPAPTVVAQPLTLLATVTLAPVAGTPTGQVTFTEDGQAIGSMTLDAAGSASLTLPAPVGSHIFAASFAGSPGNPGSASAGVVVTVVIQATTTTLIGPSAASVFGRPVPFAAVVAPATSGGPAPTGLVAFVQGSTVLGEVPLDANGVALFFTNTLPLGSDVVAAVYLGDPSNAISLSNYVAEAILPTYSATHLIAPKSPVRTGRPASFAAIVSPTVGDAIPTGTVAFAEGGVLLGEAPLNASGVAVFITDRLPRGRDLVAAVYLGDPLNTLSLSNYVAVRVRPAVITAERASLPVPTRHKLK